MISSILIAAALFVSPAHADRNDKLHAGYSVPVPAELEPFSHFKIDDVRIRERNGKTELRYTLPRTLTGIRQKVTFEGVREGDKIVASGPHGSLACEAQTCSIDYENLAIDSDLARQILIGSGHTGLDLEARLEVQRAFAGDPKGILRFGY